MFLTLFLNLQIPTNSRRSRNTFYLVVDSRSRLYCKVDVPFSLTFFKNIHYTSICITFTVFWFKFSSISTSAQLLRSTCLLIRKKFLKRNSDTVKIEINYLLLKIQITILTSICHCHIQTQIYFIIVDEM